MATDAVIRTGRLALCPMESSDAARFHALVTRPEVARMLFMFHSGWPLAEARVFLDDWAWRGTLGFRLAICEDGVWCGWIGASDDIEPEVFYALTAEASRRGIAREALIALCGFLFRRFDIPALTAGAFFDNPASMAVLRAAGFTETGVELHGSNGRDAPAPCHRFRLVRPADLPTLARR